MHLTLPPLFSIALILGFGIIFARLANLIKLPSVTGYIILGILIGPYILSLVSKDILSSSSFITTMVLTVIAYSLGPSFKIKEFRKKGKSVIFISIGEVLGAFIIVTLGIWLIGGVALNTAMLIGAIAPATDPAAIILVAKEYRAKGEVTDTLLRVVAIDDAWGIMLFAIVLALYDVISGASGSAQMFKELLKAVIEIVGSMGIGITIGIVFKLFIRFIKTKSQLVVFVFFGIFLAGGTADMLHLSPLLSGMALGATVANLINSKRIFNILEGIDAPLYILFFVLAGATLNLSNMLTPGIIALIYVFTRLPGEMLGAFLGAKISKASDMVKKYLGLALAPQAGVAIGLAIIVAHKSQAAGSLILATIIVTTVIYELFGPVLVKIALEKAGEITK